MPIDPSIIPTQIKGPDFQGFANGLIGLAQKNLQTQALKQQLGANQAASQAIQANTDSQGNVDVPNTLAALAQNPQSAYNLPQVATQLYQMQGANYNAQNAKLEGIQKQLGYWNGQLGGLMAKGENVTRDDVIGSIAGGIKSGMISPAQGIQYSQDIPADPSALSGWVKNHWLGLQSAHDQLATVLPQGGVVNAGGQQFFTNRDPLTGKVQLVGGVSNTLTPQDLTAPKTITMPDGSQRQVTTQEWLALQGAGSGAGAGMPSGYTGRNDGSGMAVQSGPGTLSSLGPGQQSALAAQGASSNTAAQSLHDSAADAPMRVNLLNTARDALSQLDATGSGTDWRNKLASALQATPGLGNLLTQKGPDGKPLILDPNKIASYEEFKKILTNYASSVSGSLGSGTDARLNAAVTGNANPNISKMANQDILAKTIAGEKMRAAQDYAFQNSGLTTDKFNQWQSQWNKNVNPDAFVYDAMSPDQRAAYKARVAPQQFEKLRQDYNTLAKQGLITPGQ